MRGIKVLQQFIVSAPECEYILSQAFMYLHTFKHEATAEELDLQPQAYRRTHLGIGHQTRLEQYPSTDLKGAQEFDNLVHLVQCFLQSSLGV